MYKYVKYYLLLLAFFVVDKVALVPTVKLNFTNAAAANPYEETLDDQEPPAFDPNRQTVWVFGSSRSMPFLRFPVDRQTAVDPFLKEDEKRAVLDRDFKAFTYSAANPYLLLTRLHQLLDRGLRPSLIAVELSPSALNKNRSINNVINMDGIALSTAILHPASYPYEMRKDVLLSRLFATYRYKTDFLALLAWRPRKEATLFQQFGGQNAFQQGEHQLKERVNRSFTDDEWGDLPLIGGDKSQRAQRFDLFTHFHEELYFTGWQFDPAMVDAIVSMARIGHEKGIPVVVYKPSLYPSMNALKTKYGFETEILPRLLKGLKPYGAHYLDLNAPGLMKCQYFTDASHLSPRCFTEMSARLIQSAEQ